MPLQDNQLKKPKKQDKIDESLVLSDDEANKVNDENNNIDDSKNITNLLRTFYKFKAGEERFDEEHQHDGKNSQKLSAKDLFWFDKINGLSRNVEFEKLAKLLLGDATLDVKTGDIDTVNSTDVNSTNAAITGTFILGNITLKGFTKVLADDETHSLPEEIIGMCFAMLAGSGDGSKEYALFAIGYNPGLELATQDLMAFSTDVASTDTDGKFCIDPVDKAIILRNRLGTGKTLKYILFY